MKKINILGLLVLIGLFAGCSSKPEPVKSNPPASPPQSTPAPSQTQTPSPSAPAPPPAAPVQVFVPPAPPPVPKNPYFDGDGGKEFTLAVLEPTGIELTDDERYLLPLVQGSITGDFNKYSAMTIIDRQNLDKILAEQTQSLSGDYSDEDYLSIGNLTNARYILSGSITKTASNYVLELSISDAQSGERKASYPPKPVSPLALENLSAVKEASADLLAQLGVQLTAQGKQELSATVNTNSVNAETALSKALTAQKNGTVVEALSYFYQAVNYDSSLTEAASRLNVLSADITSGNIGANARNDIQWRKDWLARLTEAEEYFANYMKDPPPYSLVYSTDLKQGNINYETETLDIGFNIYLISNRSWRTIPVNVVNQVRAGLEATGRTKDWGLDWPRKSIASISPFTTGVNWWTNNDQKNWIEERVSPPSARDISSPGYALTNYTGKRFNVTVELLNETGQVIGRQNVALLYGWDTTFSSKGALVITPIKDQDINVTFSGVKADDVTDKLNINIASIDGVNAQTVSQNKRISIMPFDEYTKNDVRYKIGDRGPAGGIVFYDRGMYLNGEMRYLEAAPEDNGRRTWYDAVAYCRSLNIGGYMDWRLPDVDELDLMYIKIKGLGNFNLSNAYWSSSALEGRDLSWYQRFSDGYRYYNNKGLPFSVRAVRAF